MRGTVSFSVIPWLGLVHHKKASARYLLKTVRTGERLGVWFLDSGCVILSECAEKSHLLFDQHWHLSFNETYKIHFYLNSFIGFQIAYTNIANYWYSLPFNQRAPLCPVSLASAGKMTSHVPSSWKRYPLQWGSCTHLNKEMRGNCDRYFNSFNSLVSSFLNMNE